MPVLNHDPRKTVQRFCDHDMRHNKGLQHRERIGKIATRF